MIDEKKFINEVSDFFIREFGENPLMKGPIQFRAKHMLKKIQTFETIDEKLIFLFLILKLTNLESR